jgi:hypothetical protein
MTRNTVHTCNDENIVPVSIQRYKARFVRFVASKFIINSAESLTISFPSGDIGPLFIFTPKCLLIYPHHSWLTELTPS